LMNLMLREKKQSRESALKVLDYATTGPEGKENCQKFVDILGLRTLFPLFMRTPSKVKRKDTTPDDHEEHVCAVIASLLKACSEENRTRIITKFVEHEHEKIDRLVELLLKYRERVDRFETRRAKRRLTEPSGEEEEDGDRDYLDKLDAGLYTLQRVCLVLADCCLHISSCHQRAVKLLTMKGADIKKQLAPIIEEYGENLGEEAQEERIRTKQMVEKILAWTT